MAQNGKGKGDEFGDMAPTGDGRQGKLVLIVLGISVILLLVMAFLWAREVQTTRSLRTERETNESTIKDLTAEKEQALKEVGRLRSAPSAAQDEVRKLNDRLEEVSKQASLAELQRQDAADELTECQRENIDLKSAVAEMEKRIQALEQGRGAGEAGGGR